MNESLVHGVGLIGIGLAVVLPFLKLPVRWEHIVGGWGLGWFVLGNYLGLFWAPQERMMGDAGRILYVHVPAAWVAMIAFTVGFVAALGFLVTGKKGWDNLVEASAEVGVVECVLLLVLGSIFARPTWGVWWSWDPRLTSSAVLLLSFVGVLLLRSVVTDADRRASWSSVATILAFVNIPITYMSVKWWRSLHQLQSPKEAISEPMYLVLYMNSWALVCITIWFLARRWRIAEAHALAEAPAPLPEEVPA